MEHTVKYNRRVGVLGHLNCQKFEHMRERRIVKRHTCAGFRIIKVAASIWQFAGNVVIVRSTFNLCAFPQLSETMIKYYNDLLISMLEKTRVTVPYVSESGPILIPAWSCHALATTTS